MKKRMILFFVLALFVKLVYPQNKTFVKEYNYQASEMDSKIDARENALAQVQRLLLQEVVTYVESNVENISSETSINNQVVSTEQFQAKVRTMSAGLVKTKILEETWNGIYYWLKVEITINENDLSERINKLLAEKNVQLIPDWFNKPPEFEDRIAATGTSTSEEKAIVSALNRFCFKLNKIKYQKTDDEAFSFKDRPDFVKTIKTIFSRTLLDT